MKEIGAFTAKTHFSKLLTEVAAGKTITITKRGVKIAVLTPVVPQAKLDKLTISQKKPIMTTETQNLADFLLQSPLAGLDLSLLRNKTGCKDFQFPGLTIINPWT